MMRHPWTCGDPVRVWHDGFLSQSARKRAPVRQESFHALSADRDLRLISEHSPYMRTER
jgi:hypothetical protein